MRITLTEDQFNCLVKLVRLASTAKRTSTKAEMSIELHGYPNKIEWEPSKVIIDIHE